MSGAFGWGGNDSRRARDYDDDRGFTRARDAYQAPLPPSPPPPATPATQAPQSRGQGSQFWRTPPSQPAPAPVPTSAPWWTPKSSGVVVNPKNRKLVCTAENVLVVCLDGTGSLGTWRSEIWARVRLLFEEAKALLGADLQIVFATFGDVKCSDEIQVADPGAGPILDTYLSALSIDYRGGGDEAESPEILAYYLLEQVDVSACKHVYAYFITDEKAAYEVDPDYAEEYLGIRPTASIPTHKLFQRLCLKMDTYLILKKTDMRDYSPERIRAFWDEMLPGRVLPLDDGRRVVDVMLACVAKTTGQMGAFQQSFMARNQGSQYAAENFQTVNQSVALVGGSKALQSSAHRPSRLMND